MRETCGSYPIYPTYNNGMPGPLPMGMMPPYMNNNDMIIQQINSLEQRVTNLEKMINNPSYSQTSYNSTNYQM